MLRTAHGERVAVDRYAFRSAFHLVRRVDLAKPAFGTDNLLPARERRPLHPVAELRRGEDAEEIRAGIRHEEVIGRVERQRMRIPKARIGEDRYRSGPEPEPVTRGNAVPTLEYAYGMVAVIGNRQPLPDGENAKPSGSAKPCQSSKQGCWSKARGESERLR